MLGKMIIKDYRASTDFLSNLTSQLAILWMRFVYLNTVND